MKSVFLFILFAAQPALADIVGEMVVCERDPGKIVKHYGGRSALLRVDSRVAGKRMEKDVDLWKCDVRLSPGSESGGFREGDAVVCGRYTGVVRALFANSTMVVDVESHLDLYNREEPADKKAIFVSVQACSKRSVHSVQFLR